MTGRDPALGDAVVQAGLTLLEDARSALTR